jgi:hypothetical protein
VTTGPSRMAKSAESSSTAEARLEEIANLLSVALHRARARKTDGRKAESSTGLSTQTERVLTPENGL